MQTSRVKPTEDIEHCVKNFERTLIRVRDSITEIERESRTKRLGRLLFANKTKEKLSSLRRELGDAHNRFMASVSFPIFVICGLLMMSVSGGHDVRGVPRREGCFLRCADSSQFGAGRSI
ncbi:hypothetical protein PM082_004731 [Marasmius tenuissimus]|nr:hypothetical protein PM082_004731 [Marasmius tenuissimus]